MTNLDAVREFQYELVKKESDEYQRLLGVEPSPTTWHLGPLPAHLTPEKAALLANKGFGIRALPRLVFPTSYLRPGKVEAFLTQIQSRYPNYRPYEQLSLAEQSDPLVPRNLSAKLWESVVAGDVDLRIPNGSWVAVETISKPVSGEQYKKPSFVTDSLDLGNRFTSFNIIAERLRFGGAEKITKALDLSGHKVGFLDIWSYNLLANREGWGATDTSEWTSTALRLNRNSTLYIQGGNSQDGGAASARSDFPVFADPTTGFRVAVWL